MDDLACSYSEFGVDGLLKNRGFATSFCAAYDDPRKDSINFIQLVIDEPELRYSL